MLSLDKVSDFDSITPFSLVREISVAGPASPAIYLLLCKEDALQAVADDLVDELRVIEPDFCG